jgi:hypothetical protein
MRRFIALALVLGFALALPIAPAFADDRSIGQAPAQFHALAGLLDGKRATPIPMTNEQLAAVEGMGFAVCTFCANSAWVGQVNVNTSKFGRVKQSNSAFVYQRIN